MALADERRPIGLTRLHERQRAAWCTEQCTLMFCDQESKDCVALNVAARRRRYMRERYQRNRDKILAAARKREKVA